MDPDMNKYDLEHVTTAHSQMSAADWNRAYQGAWRGYYSDAHVETVLRRARAMGLNVKKTADMLTLFAGAVRIENVHPLQFGFIRRKVRTQRRPTMPMQNPAVFYPKRAWEIASGLVAWAEVAWRYHRILRRVMADPNGSTYVDEALRADEQAEPVLPEFVHAFANQLLPSQRASVRSLAAE
jgi:hypothetical protein